MQVGHSCLLGEIRPLTVVLAAVLAVAVAVGAGVSAVLMGLTLMPWWLIGLGIDAALIIWALAALDRVAWRRWKDGAMADPSRPAPTMAVLGEDWYGRDLSGQVHTRVAFVDVDMTEVSSTGAVFEECTFRNVRFNVSVHTDTAFVNCAFTRCSFFDARFERCKLIGSVFDGCTFEIARVTGGNWSFVGLPRADLTSATVVGARMCEADLTGLRCHDGTLRDVDLSGATLAGADLSGCDLRGAVLAGIDPLAVDLRGAIITLEQAVAVAEGLGLDVRVE